MKKYKRYIVWGITALLVVIGSLMAYYAMYHFGSLKSGVNNIISILMPVIDGIILAYFLTPLQNAIERNFVKPIFAKFKAQNKRNWIRFVSMLITIVFTITLIVGFLSAVIPQIANSILTIIQQFPSYEQTLDIWINKLLDDNPEIAKLITDTLDSYSNSLNDFVDNTVIPKINEIVVEISMSVVSIFTQLWNLIIGFIISLYLLASKERFAAQAKKIVYAFTSEHTGNRFINNVRFASNTFLGFFVGKILDSMIIGALCFVVTSIMGTPFNVLVSVIVGVTNIIPFFGPFFGAIPSLILIVFVDPLQAFYFLIFVIILQQLDGNFIGPKILGSSTGLSSFWVIFAITFFGGIWGVFGMIVGVPIFAIIYAFIKSFVEFRLEKKGLPTDTKLYLKLFSIDSDTKEPVEFSEEDARLFANIKRVVVKGQENIHKEEILIKHENAKKDNSKDAQKASK